MKLLIASAGMLVAIGTLPGHAKTETHEYIAAGTSDAVTVCADENPAGTNIGSACTNVGPGKSITIDVADAAFENTSFYWVFYDANGDCAETGPPIVPGGEPGCASDGFGCDTLTVTSPPKTARVEILLDGPVFSAGGPCDAGTTGPATIGTVTFTITNA